jgi:hypothetical protein
MKKLIYILIFLLYSQLFAQGFSISIKGGFDYNFITAGAFKHVGYEKNKYLYTGHIVGIGFIGDDGALDFEFADLKAKGKLNGKDTDLKLSILTMSLLIGSFSSLPLAGGIRADLGIGFSSRNVYSSMSIGPEFNFFLARNFGFFVAGLLNLGFISQSAEINDIPEISSGLSSGPEIKTGIRLVF